jgi:hypothetical protein
MAGTPHALLFYSIKSRREKSPEKILSAFPRRYLNLTNTEIRDQDKILF